jgi:hypothetical protein
MWITSSSSVALVLNECPLAQRSSTQTVQVCPGRNVATDAQLRYGWRDGRLSGLIVAIHRHNRLNGCVARSRTVDGPLLDIDRLPE